MTNTDAKYVVGPNSGARPRTTNARASSDPATINADDCQIGDAELDLWKFGCASRPRMWSSHEDKGSQTSGIPSWKLTTFDTMPILKFY